MPTLFPFRGEVFADGFDKSTTDYNFDEKLFKFGELFYEGENGSDAEKEKGAGR